MKVYRLPDWERRMRLVLKERLHMPFDIVTNDCLKFSAAVFEAITGVDAAVAFRDYGSEREARLRLIKLGPGGFFFTVDKVLTDFGLYQVPWSQAHRGDPVWMEAEGNLSLGICGGGKVLTPGKSGLAQLPMSVVQCAWRIPYGP